MKRILCLLCTLGILTTATARSFEQTFCDSTLRLDYTFCGNNRQQQIYLDGLSSTPGWYGRHVNLNRLLLQGNGQITMTDTLGRDTLYRHSFSTLFQEWQTTEEATRLHRSFENVFLVPMPRQSVDITVSLTDTHNRVLSSFTHRVSPTDSLIRRPQTHSPWEYLQQEGDSRDCIDVTFVPEGYTSGEMDQFRRDCQESIQSLLSHEPFASQHHKFNFVAVNTPSPESGASIPYQGIWRNTLLGCHFHTFYSHRYLTTPYVKRLHDVLSGVPCEQIIILVNTDNYGGGGIYNSYVTSSARNPKSRPVLVHEFGHHFGGLGDEYYYDDQYETNYPSDTEPWEPNLTTLVDFRSKWRDMLPDGTPVPTPADGTDPYTRVGVYEGGGYQSHGIYRPSQDCRMKTNTAPRFCPVCTRALDRMILYYTQE